MITKPLKIVAVCGCGMGSSVILRMNAEKALKELQIPGKIEVADVTTGKGAARDADLILVSSELLGLFKDAKQPVIALKSFVNKNELIEKLRSFMETYEEKQ